MARLTRPTDRGGFLDITLDFILYSGFVFAFAVPTRPGTRSPRPSSSSPSSAPAPRSSPLPSWQPSAGSKASASGRKSLYYLGGLTEGTETILFLALMCLWPAAFPILAWVFGTLCWITTGARVAIGMRELGP